MASLRTVACKCNLLIVIVYILDIDECSNQTAACGVGVDQCTDTSGSHNCTCLTGYTSNTDDTFCNGTIQEKKINEIDLSTRLNRSWIKLQAIQDSSTRQCIDHVHTLYKHS